MSKALTLPPEYHSFRRGDRTLFLDPVNHVWFATDAFGVEVLSGLAAGGLDEALARLAALVGRTTDDVALIDYVATFTSQLQETGFLHEGGYSRKIPDQEPLAYPVVMYVHLTNACNLSCSYCYNQEHRYQRTNERARTPTGERLSFAQTTAAIKAVITDAAALGLQEVKLTGGEATLNRDFLDIARHAKSLGLQVNLLTNGALITERLAREIVPVIDAVSVSLDSADAALHDAARGRGSHAKALSAIAALKAAGLGYLHVNGVVTPLTIDTIDSLLDFAWKDLQATQVELAGSYLQVKDPDKKWGAADSFLSEEEIPRLELGQYQYYKDRGAPPELEFHNHCGVGNGVISLDFNGDLYPCQTLHEEEFKCGNAFQEGYKHVVEMSPVRQMAAKATVDTIEECNVCPVRYLCASGCRSEAWTREGGFLARNKATCPSNYALAVNRLWDTVDMAEAR